MLPFPFSLQRSSTKHMYKQRQTGALVCDHGQLRHGQHVGLLLMFIRSTALDASVIPLTESYLGIMSEIIRLELK